MKGNKQNKMLFLAAPLIVLWCFAAWLIADHHYFSQTQNLIDEETHITEERVDYLSDNIRRNLQSIGGISEMTSHLVRVRAATRRFKTGSAPSMLPYEERKKSWTQDPVLNDLSQFLSIVQASLNVDLIYLVDAAGDCIAASNWGKPGSIIGTNYAERDFFLSNKAGKSGMQYAVGKTTNIPGFYFSSPVLIDGQFMGAVVTKVDVQNLSFITNQLDGYVVDQNGVIILAHDKSMEMQVLPGSAIASMPEEIRMARYQRRNFTILPIEQWGGKDFSALWRISGEKVPHVRASRALEEYDLTAYVKDNLVQLAILERERLWLFLLEAFFGSALILSATGLFFYLRAIKKSKAALQESEAKLQAIIDATPVPFALNDAHGNITYLNKAFEKIIGYTRDDIPTLEDWWPRAYPDSQYRQWVMENWQNNMEETRRTNKPFHPMELSVRCKDDAVRTFMIGISPLIESYSGTHLVILYDITERKAAELEINNLAFYDSLTSLPNRRLLLDRLHQALASSARSGKKGALLFIDLDNFKTLNDTLGHDFGDLLLQRVAQRLKSCMREVDTVARLGGDEFVVMLEDLSVQALEAAAQTEIVGEKILAALSHPYQLGSHEYHGTPSIGATVFNGQQQEMEELLKQADIAMYQSKKSGRNALRFFDPYMQDSINTRADLEGELHKALENQQFHLYYQIQVDSTHHPLGAEALIRWIHPERGMVSPAQFIPLAEETGLILPIGQWVLETACTQLKAWQQDALSRDLVLAVNVSARQFRQADFVSQVQTAVQRHAINPMLLKLELTESMLLENIKEIIATMNALKEIGVQFSLDDFGTGYSSLQYLKRLPLDQLKIDQTFVRDLATDSSDKAIVRTIIAMAHSLNLSVIAEGVETEEQQLLLKEAGCTHYQGYLFSKPVPIVQFEALLKRG